MNATMTRRFNPVFFIDVTHDDPVTQVMNKYGIETKTVSKILDIKESVLMEYRNGSCIEPLHVMRFIWALQPSSMQSMVECTYDLTSKERSQINARINMINYLNDLDLA